MEIIIKREDVQFTIEPDKCCGCGSCVKTCQEDVWRWDEDLKFAVPRYAEECVQCLQCEVDCLGRCFDIRPIVVMQSDPLENTMLD